MYFMVSPPLLIDKLYTKNGNVFRLHLRIEPFAVLFWALGIVLCAYIETVDPACRPVLALAQYCTAGVS